MWYNLFRLVTRLTSARSGSLAALAALLVLIPLQSQAGEESFFTGKTLTIYVGFSPGGGVDTNSRLVARYLTKQIPGAPKVIVKNMPGASGVLLANHLYHREKPNGLAIGFPGRSYPLAPLLGDPGAKFVTTKFSFIGTVSQPIQVLFLRSALGIKNLDELKRTKKQIYIPGLSNRASNVMVPRVLKKYMGWPLNAVPGYTATAKMHLALESGEGDGIFSAIESIKGTRPDLFESLVPIVQTGPYFPGVPLLRDEITEDVKALLDLIRAPALWGVPLIGPPGIPENRLAVLRKAFIRMTEQEVFKRDAKRQGLQVKPLNGEELEKVVKGVLTNASDKVVSEYKSIMAGK